MNSGIPDVYNIGYVVWCLILIVWRTSRTNPPPSLCTAEEQAAFDIQMSSDRILAEVHRCPQMRRYIDSPVTHEMDWSLTRQ